MNSMGWETYKTMMVINSLTSMTTTTTTTTTMMCSNFLFLRTAQSTRIPHITTFVLAWRSIFAGCPQMLSRGHPLFDIIVRTGLRSANYPKETFMFSHAPFYFRSRAYSIFINGHALLEVSIYTHNKNSNKVMHLLAVE